MSIVCKKTQIELDLKADSLLSGNFSKKEMVEYIYKYKARHIKVNRNISRDELVIEQVKANDDFDALWSFSNVLKTTCERKDFLSELEARIKNKSSFKAVGYFEKLRLVCDELLTNAFYNGASTGTGIDRKEAFSLTNDHEVKIELSESESFFKISVKDSFGKLSFNQYVESLYRGQIEKTPQKKEGGAGLGLYFLFDIVQKTEIKVKRDVETEFICYLVKSKRLKNIENWAIEFHFYQED